MFGRRPAFTNAGIAVIAIGAGCLLLHLLWLRRFRWGYPTEWDEAGYIAIAVRDTQALQDGGVVSMLRMVVGQEVQAPLVPLATVPFHVLFGTGVDQSLLTVPLFFVVLVAATYGVAVSVVPRRWAVLATLVVATAPVVTDYSRLLHFSVPASAMMATAVWALLRSEHLRNRRFAVTAGIFLGLTVLARTMTIAFVPGIALAAAIQALAPEVERRRRVANLGLAGLAAAAVASTWYVRNWRGVYDYLVGAGYGASSERYGGGESAFSPDAVGTEVETLLRQLYLPLVLVLGGAALVAGVCALGRGVRTRPRSPLRAWISSPVLSLLVIVVVGYLALVSSRNVGTAFGLPLLPMLTILVVAAVAGVPGRTVRAVLAATLAVVSIGNVAMKSGLSAWASKSRAVDLLGMRSLPVVEGTGIIQGEAFASGYRVSPTEPLPQFHRDWLSFERRLVRRISDDARQFRMPPTGVLGARHLLLTNTSLRLAATLERRDLVIGWLDAPPDSEDAYARQLREAQASFLVVAESAQKAVPGVTVEKAESAARSLGFRLTHTLTLPDGREARLWWLRSPLL